MNARKNLISLGIMWYVVFILMMVTADNTGCLLALLAMLAIISYRIAKGDISIKEIHPSENDSI